MMQLSRRLTHAQGKPAASRAPAAAPFQTRSKTVSDKPPPRPPKTLPQHMPANRHWYPSNAPFSLRCLRSSCIHALHMVPCNRYAGTLDRREAESKLLLAHSGAFLVRAASPGNYRVAVKTDAIVRHLRVYTDKVRAAQRLLVGPSHCAIVGFGHVYAGNHPCLRIHTRADCLLPDTLPQCPLSRHGPDTAPALRRSRSRS